MIQAVRHNENPLVKPDPAHDWEEKATFNGSILRDGSLFRFVYRALSKPQDHLGKHLEVSSIGYTESVDGVHFSERKQLLKPELDWEKYGCEDPRITKIDNEYFIFYTALSDYPFYPAAIKVGVATGANFDQLLEKHLVTPFNAKAMVLFPEKINGKYAALVTAHTDMPPAQIAIAYFDKKEDIWSPLYWRSWYQNLAEHVVPLQRMNSDQLEVGTVPILTEHGWLLIYAHIQHYYNEHHRLFGIEAVLLDRTDPQKVIGRIEKPLLLPEKDYELHGIIPNVVFPSSAYIDDNQLHLYYGAADTSCCLATYDLNELWKEMQTTAVLPIKAKKLTTNPIIEPVASHIWEAKAVFNPAAFYAEGAFHIVYRAMSHDNTSVFGYAKTEDGIKVTERLEMPIYVPRADFERKKHPNGNSGCEDPRITVIGETLYMCYTAFDGVNPPRVAMTSLSVADFLKKNFNWSHPKLISPPGIDDKDAAIFPERILNKHVIIHRIQNSIVLDYVDDLHFEEDNWLRSIAFIPPRGHSWDSEKIGVCSPPIKTPEGWVLLYHGVSKLSHAYRVGAMLLDLTDPSHVLARTPWPILEPEAQFEKQGIVQNVVFPCSAIVKDNKLYTFYGGADTVICMAVLPFLDLVGYLLEIKNKRYLVSSSFT